LAAIFIVKTQFAACPGVRKSSDFKLAIALRISAKVLPPTSPTSTVKGTLTFSQAIKTCAVFIVEFSIPNDIVS
jgi:hypothetical protein